MTGVMNKTIGLLIDNQCYQMHCYSIWLEFALYNIPMYTLYT